MLPSKARCEEVLKEENRDIEVWLCPFCNQEGSRAHWVADHILNHLREQETQVEQNRYKRPIEVD